MARKNIRRQESDRFIRLIYPLINSDAYKSLSAQACRLLTAIQVRYNGQNNGEIPLSVREAAATLHSGLTKASKAFKELERKGFIKCTTGSSFDYKKHARRWALTFESLNNQRPTNEWKKLSVLSGEHIVSENKL